MCHTLGLLDMCGQHVCQVISIHYVLFLFALQTLYLHKLQQTLNAIRTEFVVLKEIACFTSIKCSYRFPGPYRRLDTSSGSNFLDTLFGFWIWPRYVEQWYVVRKCWDVDLVAAVVCYKTTTTLSWI